MYLLNLGCGNVRPPLPFHNVDTLKAEHRFEGPECAQLTGEENYLEYNLHIAPWPWADGCVDGILASHVFEHFECQFGLMCMRECHRMLKEDGIVRISVPDASYFRQVHAEDNAANAQRLFGQPLYEKSTMMDYALFFTAHKQVFSEDGLWCLLANGGFSPNNIHRTIANQTLIAGEAAGSLAAYDTRASFSLIMEARK